eukprot:12746263-Prorocentrum_lima.AAC.1
MVSQRKWKRRQDWKASSSGGFTSTFHSQQVSRGLSELLDAPRTGIIYAWLVSNVVQDPGERSPEDQQP